MNKLNYTQSYSFCYHTQDFYFVLPSITLRLSDPLTLSTLTRIRDVICRGCQAR